MHVDYLYEVLLDGDASRGQENRLARNENATRLEWHKGEVRFDGPESTRYNATASISVSALPNAASSSQRCAYGLQRSYADADG